MGVLRVHHDARPLSGRPGAWPTAARRQAYPLRVVQALALAWVTLISLTGAAVAGRGEGAAVDVATARVGAAGSLENVTRAAHARELARSWREAASSPRLAPQEGPLDLEEVEHVPAMELLAVEPTWHGDGPRASSQICACAVPALSTDAHLRARRSRGPPA